MNLTRRVVLAALTLAALMALMLVSSAFADVKINIGAGGTTANSVMNFKVEGVPTNFNEDLWGPGPGFLAHFILGTVNPVDNKAVGRALYSGPGTDAAAGAWCFGDAKLGGESQIEALPDSVAASVGLYQANGGTALGSNQDSLVRFSVGRSGTTVTLSIPNVTVSGQQVGSGGLQVNTFNPTQVSIAEVRVAVYNDQAAANADVTSDGTGAAFFGKVALTSGGRGAAPAVVASGGFNHSDFILQSHGGNKYTARPIANWTRDVTVTDANTAVVVILSDPKSLVPVPSSTPYGLGLLALALMGGGLWVMRSRRRVEAV